MDGRMKFEQLCETFDKIVQARTKEKKLKILNKLLDSCRGNNTPLVSSFFSLVRLVIPKLDSERGSYDAKQTKLANMYIRILCLPKDGQDAKKLLKFRSEAAGRSAGDFAEVAFWILKSRCRAGGNYTVDDVNYHLDKIASTSKKSRDDELTEILLNMSAGEQKWLIRLLLKDLHLGLPKSAIWNAVHPDAKDLYDACNNLRKVCETLKEKDKRLHEIEVSLFEPCHPMLSERCDILTVEALFKSSPFYYVEKKHDGERFQIHIQNGSFRYFSRKGHDYTSNFGWFTPFLAKQFHTHVQSCILDGEMMGWNTTENNFAAKSSNIDIKNLKAGDEVRPCYCLFDILLLNGEVLTNKPVKERLVILESTYIPLDGVLMRTPRQCLSSGSDVVHALNEAIGNLEEGLILKHPESVYKPATKRGGWYKIKPEYTVGLTDELDLIIMGGYFGKSKPNTISHYLLGVAVAPEIEGSPPTEFHSVVRVGSGYTAKEHAQLLEKLSPHWKAVMGAPMPSGLVWTKERPDLYIEPQNSQILQVKASEITESLKYKCGYTLRFPRVEKIRYDKNWLECCNTSDFESLRLSHGGKLATRHVDTADLTQVSPVSKRRRAVAPKVGKNYQAADLSEMVTKGKIFEGREICVLTGNEKCSKQDLEKKIHEQGGTIVQNRGPETFCVVAGKKDLRLKNLEDKGDVDVVTVTWVLHVLDSERLTEWEPQDLLVMSSSTQDKMDLKYDTFLDSYHKPTTEEKLKESLQKVSEKDYAVNLLPMEMGDLDVELFSDHNPFAVFRGCTALFHSSHQEEVAFSCSLLKAMFIFQGGRVNESHSMNVTHVIIQPNDTQALEYCQQMNASQFKKFHIVTSDWIESCWSCQRHLHEADFHPHSVSKNMVF